MKLFKRLLLLAVAVAIGAWLGCKLLPGTDMVNTISFMLACTLVGNVFSWIDKRICEKR